MASNSGVVGVLRALLTADTGQFDTAMRKAAGNVDLVNKASSDLENEIKRLAPLAERMTKSLLGQGLVDRANALSAAITQIGGASKLTDAQMRRANATLAEAIQHNQRFGIVAPKAWLDLEQATRKVIPPVKEASLATRLLSSSFATLTASFTAANTINRVIGSITNLAREAIAGAGALVDMSGKTGLSTETLQRMGFVADQTGATLEDFTTASFRLGVTVAAGSVAARKAFEDLVKSSDALGMSFEAFQKLRPDEQFARVTAALHDVRDEQERNRLGTALMGRQYATIAAAVAENYNEMAKAAKISSDAQIHAIDDAVDAWHAFVKEQETSITSMLGNVVLFAQAMAKARAELAEQSRNPMVAGPFANTDVNEAEIRARALMIVQEGLLRAKTKDIDLTNKSAAATESYVAMLRHAEAELNALTPAQLREIDAAQKLGISTQTLEDKYGLTAGTLSLLTARTRDHLQAIKDLDKEQKEAAERQKEGRDAMLEDLFKVEGQIEALQDKSAAAQERIAQETAQKQLEIFLDLNKSLFSLDAERLRTFMSANAPATRFDMPAQKMGETIGAQINTGIGRAFEQIPHFLTSSIIHSGSFINGLKAIGVDMADAIVEPLIKRFVAKIAGARLGAALAGGTALGGAAAAAGTVAAGAGAAAGGVGATTGAAGGLGASAAAFATNPFTIAAAAGIAGVLLFRHFRDSTNDKRDKFLAQFAGFDTTRDKADTANPPGFHGLDRYLTKYHHHDWFTSLIGARDGSMFKNFENVIAGFVGSQGRTIKSFAMGGFVPPGVVQPAILHGGAFGEDIQPRGAGPMGGATFINHWNISATDGPSVQRLVRSPEFISEVRSIIKLNHRGVGSTIRRITTGID